MQSWSEVFDKEGMFLKENYDPYRVDDEDEFHNKIFDDDGDVRCENPSLQAFILNNKVSWSSDAVQLYYAEEFARNTKGNYSTVYMWR
jgi:hypothetical protein